MHIMIDPYDIYGFICLFIFRVQTWLSFENKFQKILVFKYIYYFFKYVKKNTSFECSRFFLKSSDFLPI